MSTYARTSLRTRLRPAIAVAALAGALLTPAAACAATSTGGAPAATASSAAGRHDRGCTVTQSRSIGAGTTAVTSMSPSGPTVTFQDGPGTPVPSLGKLDRAHPKLPASAGIYVEILNPYGAAPQLKSKVEGGAGASYAIQKFPALPKGCALNGAGAAKTPSSAPSAAAPGQTSVVPKGAVAAAPEFTTRP
ncbi:hypothetical protein ACFYN0_13375 [Streptomyces sp. NPDC006704]|uniref:hypothetical protein n=1 Tax=Streptomyces sp. NPDC006704 TaxID=3364760 RepID=UPI0036BF3F06